MENRGTVSVVLTTYNGEKYLREQLDSILDQTYPIYEIIVQDDCSNDATVGILRQYASRYSFIKIFCNTKNLGYNENFRSAVTRASGDYIALSDQDDIWLPDHIEVLFDAIGTNVIACGNSLILDQESNKILNEQFDIELSKVPCMSLAYGILYNKNFLGGACCLMTSQFAKNAFASLPSEVDYYDVWLVLYSIFIGKGVAVTDRSVRKWRRHSKNSSGYGRYSLRSEFIRHSHPVGPADRLAAISALENLFGKEYDDIDTNNKRRILQEAKAYYQRAYSFKYRFWCMSVRFRHYKEIYYTKSYLLFLPRLLQFMLLPAGN